MFGFQIPAFDRFSDTGIQRFAFQIIVDVLVGDTQGHFIRQGGAIVFQVGGRQLLIQMFRAAEMGQQLFALTFVQAENWVDVGAAVAIFGEEAGNRFRRMVVPTTTPLVIPAMLYWAFIRSRAFSLPRTKSLSSIPASRSACSLASTRL